MATRPSSLTLFDRATPARRAEIRQKALAVPCPDCKARAHETCTGINGKPAKPHYARQVRGGARGGTLGNTRRANPSAETLRAALQLVTGPECDRLALDMDHHCRDHSRWWKNVLSARKVLNPPEPKKPFPSKCSACGEQSHFGRCHKKGARK